MKFRNILFLIFICFTVSCAYISKTSTHAEKFYDLLQNQSFESVGELLDSRAYILTKKEEWVQGLKNIYEERGKIIKYEKTGIFSTVEENLTIVKLDFKVVYENGTYSEYLKFIETTDKNYKIFEYNFNVNKEQNLKSKLIGI